MIDRADGHGLKGTIAPAAYQWQPLATYRRSTTRLIVDEY